MDNDLDLYYSRIKEMTYFKEKEALREILLDVFKNITRQTHEMFDELEQRIEAEVKDSSEKYYVYTAVGKRENIDDLSKFLYEIAVVEEDSVIGETEDILSTIFLNLGYMEISKYLGKPLNAVIDTGSGSYEVNVLLSYSGKYLNKIKWLYEQFIANQKPWRTINCPYVYKFLDVTLVKNESIKLKKENITGIRFKDEKLNENIHNDMVLLWNIEEITEKVSSGTIAGVNEILYRTKIPINKESGYLAVKGEIERFYTIQSEEELIVNTEEKEINTIDLIRISNTGGEKDNTKFFLPIQTNKRKLSHLDKQADMYGGVNTQGEIERRLKTYEVYKLFNLEQIEVLEDLNIEKSKECIHTFDYNSFITSHTFLKPKRVLHIKFTAKDKEDILLYEKLSFLVSELQLYYREYRCVGELI